MAKNSGFFLTKPNAIKKIEKDINSFQFSVGEASADLINLVQLEIRKKGFLDGLGSKVKGAKRNTYKSVPGANLASKRGKNRSKAPVMKFHKTKLVNRDGDLPPLFNELVFRKENPRQARAGQLMYRSRNEAVAVRIFSAPGKVTTTYRFHGKYDKIFGVFEAGQRTIQVNTIDGKTKNQRVGQKKIVSNGFRRAMRSWKKLTNFRIEEALKQRNLAKV